MPQGVPPRIVLDTKCLVSALIISRDNLAWLRHGWPASAFFPLASKATTGELIRVLTYPRFQLSAAEQELLLADFLPYAVTIAVTSTLPDLPSIQDPADRMFLSLAVAGQADVLVSGDKDLLDLKDHFTQTPIINLAEFRLWIKDWS